MKSSTYAKNIVLPCNEKVSRFFTIDLKVLLNCDSNSACKKMLVNSLPVHFNKRNNLRLVWCRDQDLQTTSRKNKQGKHARRKTGKINIGTFSVSLEIKTTLK